MNFFIALNKKKEYSLCKSRTPVNRTIIASPIMIMIVAGFLIVIMNFLNQFALGIIAGTENDDVLVANMSIFSSHNDNNISTLHTDDQSSLAGSMSNNNDDINNSDSVDNTTSGVFMYGNYGNDEIHGMDESDHLRGGPGNDIIYGYEGGDYIEGGDGNDKLYGGGGDDILVGGPGADYFDCGDGYDIVEDFNPGDNALHNCEELLNEIG